MQKSTIDYHPLIEGCIGDLSVQASHNEDMLWKTIRIESPDNKHVKLTNHKYSDEDSISTLSHTGSMEINHPLRKYIDRDVLERVYEDSMKGNLEECR